MESHRPTLGGIRERILEEVILNFNITFYFKKSKLNAHAITCTGTRVHTGKVHLPSALSSIASQLPSLQAPTIPLLCSNPDIVLYI